MKKVCSIVGARPQFIKACPLSKEIRKNFAEVLIHTGQHYDLMMSEVFFKDMGIPSPEFNLNIGSGSHGKQTAAMIAAVEEVLISEKPDLVIVYGDTNSTLAGALAAVKLHIPIAHIESGLRSFNNLMPEEINRILVDRIASWLFVPSKTAAVNLEKEGIRKGVHNVGDIMYDALLLFKEAATMSIGLKIPVNGESYILATIHRAENTDDKNRLKDIFDALAGINRKIILPLHPRTNQRLNTYGIKAASNIHFINPVGYLEMLNLMQNASAILTDSGGIQKEAYYLKVPCVTLRDETEWIETVESGWNILAGADKAKILNTVSRLNDIKRLPHKEYYGSGDTAQRICQILLAANHPIKKEALCAG